MQLKCSELYQVLKDHAPESIKLGEIKNYFGRKVAIVCLIPWRKNQADVVGCVC